MMASVINWWSCEDEEIEAIIESVLLLRVT